MCNRALKPRKTLCLTAGLLLSTMVVGCVSSGRPALYDNPKIKRIAVLPMGDREFSDYMTETLVHESKWDVIDRGSLSRIVKELELQQSALVDPQTAVRVGKFAGVDMVVFGEYWKHTSYPQGYGASVPVLHGYAATIKAIDVETAKYLSYHCYVLHPGSLLANPKLQAKYCCQGLLPYRISHWGREFMRVVVGKDAEKPEWGTAAPTGQE